MKAEFEKTQRAELESWFSPDPKIERDKRIREIARYPLLKRQMGLDILDTSDMEVWDIGCGPFGGVSSVLSARKIVGIDPLADDYRKHYPSTARALQAEELKETLATPDLIIVTNALDHFENPRGFLEDLVHYTKPGAFFAHLHAIDNAYSHPHEAHAHNVNPKLFSEVLSQNFETVWYLDYPHDALKYGWRQQAAFSGLYRKSTGY